MNLRALRVERGLSLDELGHRAGIERSRLSRAERGYARLSDVELEKIASIIGADVEILAETSTTQND
jgi:transcriptional regulator with XRE-family HTH domain